MSKLDPFMAAVKRKIKEKKRKSQLILQKIVDPNNPSKCKLFRKWSRKKRRNLYERK